MTMKEIENGGVDDGTEAFEQVPEEVLTSPDLEPAAAETAKAQERHLAMGSSTKTLCGLDRAAVKVAHPSKARKNDCRECRDAYRLGKRVQGDETAAPPKTGDRIAFPDGSAWLVEDARESGMDVRCLIGSAANRKGKRLVISAGGDYRILTSEEFESALAASAGIPGTEETATTDGEPATEKPKRAPGAGKWAPTKKEVDAVLAMRQAGMSYIKIERELGWPDGHGNRPFRIVKGAWQYDLLRAE